MRFSSVLSLALLVASISVRAETRQWTSADGRRMQAKILGVDGGNIRLETSRGKFELPLTKLSKADQDYAKQWAEKQKAAAPASETSGRKMAATVGNFDGLKLGEWPQYVVADLEISQIKTVAGPDVAPGEFVYRTPHFEFFAPERLSVSVVREFARIFEASYAFVDQMPIGLAPKPSANGFYKTKLYMTSADYYAGGGMPGSGGMFSWQSRGNEMKGMIHVPLPNLGVEHTGTRFIVDHKKRSTTLTHEIVHQVMMRWLATSMPTWLSEGLAEVVSSQEYNNGRFKLNSMDRAIAKEVGRGGRDFRMVGLEKLMNISHSDWAEEVASGSGGRNYNSANVLTYYFLKLEGNGDAAHLVDFLKEISSGNWNDDFRKAQQNHLIRERSWEDLQAEVASAWRSEGLKIEFD